MPTDNNSLKTLYAEPLTDGRFVVSRQQLAELLAGSINVENAELLPPTKKNSLTTSAPLYSPTSDSPPGTIIYKGSTYPPLDGPFSVAAATEQRPKPNEQFEQKPVEPSKPKQGHKNDAGKPPIAMIPAEALRQAAMASAGRDANVDVWNYKMGIEITRTVSGALRHILDFMDGIDVDPRSKATSLGSAIFNLAMAIDTLKNHPHLDDRYKKESK